MGTVTRTRCSKTQRWRRGCIVDNPTAWSGFVARQRQNVAHGSEHKAPLPHLVGACCNAWWCGRRVEILDLRHKMHASAYMGIGESVMTIPAASSERTQTRKWVQGSRALTHVHIFDYNCPFHLYNGSQAKYLCSSRSNSAHQCHHQCCGRQCPSSVHHLQGRCRLHAAQRRGVYTSGEGDA